MALCWIRKLINGPSHAGVEQLKAQQAGAALRHLGDARDLLAAAHVASKAYDRADPVSSAVEHEYADLELKDAIEKPYARVSGFYIKTP